MPTDQEVRESAREWATRANTTPGMGFATAPSGGGVAWTGTQGITPRPFSEVMGPALEKVREGVSDLNRLLELLDQAAALAAGIDLSEPTPADREKLRVFGEAVNACGQLVQGELQFGLLHLHQIPAACEGAGLRERQTVGLREEAERQRQERARRYREQEAAEEARKERLRQGYPE